MHERAHEGAPETRGGSRIVRGLWLRSLQWGLVGQSDVVEFEAPPGISAADSLPNRLAQAEDADWSNWTVRPVEYKRGKPKKDDSDRVQVCAQALCLEEMLRVQVTEGALFYGQPKRRTVVLFDDPLREITLRAIQRLRQMIQQNETPPAVRAPKCDSCSLIDVCLPDAASGSRSAKEFVEDSFQEHFRSTH